MRETGDRCGYCAKLCRGVQAVHEIHGLLHVCATMFVPLVSLLLHVLPRISAHGGPVQMNSMNNRGP